MARILLLSPYHTGSHRAFAEGLVRRSRHDITLLTLPGRFWKWRMRGAALLLAARARRLDGRWDAVLATDMLNLAEFRGLWGGAEIPHLLYLHENQLDYPLPEGEPPDLHYGFINLASARAADLLIFNSGTHRDAFFAAAPRLLAAMPDCPLPGFLDGLRRRTRVLPVGCDLEDLSPRESLDAENGAPPVILWNHRWEFDKAPEVFFRVLARLDGAGLPFRLALAGENAQAEPAPFLAARRRYGDRIVSFGYVPERADYARVLQGADIVVSTALQENFGVAVVEAAACGAWPLLPRRLAYPEVLPPAFHADCLYDGEAELEARLAALLRDGLPSVCRRRALAREMRAYGWPALIGTYDDLLAGAAAEIGAGGIEKHLFRW